MNINTIVKFSVIGFVAFMAIAIAII